MKKNKEEILDFYLNFNKLKDLSSIAYINKTSLDKSRGLRQIKAQDVFVNEQGIFINIDFNTVSFIKNNISPIVNVKNGEEFVDSNSLNLAIAFMKVDFKEEEKTVYFPLITVDITHYKELMFSSVKSNGNFQLEINFEINKLTFCEEVLDYFFDFNFEENGKKEKEYLATEFHEFLPTEKRNLVDMFNHIYSFFANAKYDTNIFDITFPMLNSDKSSTFMFFNIQSNLKLSKELEEMKNENNELVNEYFFHEEENNLSFNPSDEYWTGALTKEYPLGKGQGIVLQKNQLNERIIPVIGGPGTGKSTLFLSLISNEVTKRALSNIYDNKDYNNLMLITSTANKAIENVYTSLKKGFKHGFCLVGGSNENKAASKIEVAEFIEIIKEKEFSSKNKIKYESNIKRIKTFFETRKENFLEIKKYKEELLKLKIKKFENLAYFLKNLDESLEQLNVEKIKKEIAFISTSIKQFKLILKCEIDSISSFFEILENDYLPKMNLIKNKIDNRGLIKKILGGSDKIVKEYFDISEEDFAVLFNLANVLIEKKDILQDIKKYQEIGRIKPVLDYFYDKYKNNYSLFNNFIQHDSFGEYFRTNLYNISYKFYLLCYNYLYEKMLENKVEVLKALNYIIADNQYKYFADNYRFNQDSYDKFLRFLSLAYPVTTSTLAAISNNFKEIFPSKSTTYNTILADESGMICVNDMIPILRRSNRAIIVGDPKQLPPIVSLAEIFSNKLKNATDERFWDMYSPTSLSAFHRSAGTLKGGYLLSGRGVMLDEHRRCSPKIAELFIRIGKYEGLNVKTRISTRKQFQNIKEELMFFNIVNQDKNGAGNINYNEIQVIDILLNKLEKAGYDLKKEVGIITPYKKQEGEIVKAFGSRVNHSKELSKIGTVHKFQGAEFKIIIFSSVASRKGDSLNFINSDPSLTIVSISRAIESFIVVGDYNKLTEDKSEDNFIGEMARGIKNIGFYANLQKD